MKYDSISKDIKTMYVAVKEYISEIRNIGLGTVWSGDAYNNLSNKLNEVLEKFEIEVTNLENYTKALEYMDVYIQKLEELDKLETELNNLSDDEDDQARRSELITKIAQLEAEVGELKQKITELIVFKVSDSGSYDLVAFEIDENSYKDFTYLVDLDKLIFLSDEKMLVPLDDDETLYDYYTDEEIETTLESIKANYSGREASVNCALALIQMAADVGKKLKYGGSRDIYDIAIRSDCSVFASWAINQGTENEDFTKKNVITLADSGKKYQSYSEAKPGDVLYHLGSDRSKYHATFLVKNDTENKIVTIAEASNKKNGVRLRTMSYDTLRQSGYKAVDMSEYYED